MHCTALIGYTGFVGGTLCRSRTFSDLYNSKNITDIRGKSYDQITVAAAPAEKWKANQNPEADWAQILRLIQALDEVKAREVRLISTIDVYPAPVGVDERTLIDPRDVPPYGRHRLWLEKALQDRFDCKVIRLPGLFGQGLKKNIIFDFLTGNRVAMIDTRSCFQFYNLARLADDMDRLLATPSRLINLTVAPVRTGDVAQRICGEWDENHLAAPPPLYDVRSVHAGPSGGADGYFYTAAQSLSEIGAFAKAWRRNG